MTVVGSSKHALSFDLEDWYHPELVRAHVPEKERASQVSESTEPILRLLERHRVKATFFVLGEVLERVPELVQRIEAGGHEIASHGFSHVPLWELGEERFRRELACLQELMSAVLGIGFRPRGFRAPTFSLNEQTPWAFGVLQEFGYRYDSSVLPVTLPLFRLGMRGTPGGIYPVAGSCSTAPAFWEFPLTVWEIAGLKVPIAGGFYLRAIPMRLLVGLLRRIAAERPFVVYLHPWETFGGTPRVHLSPLSSFITYHRIDRTMDKLDALLGLFPFARIDEVLGLRDTK